MRNPASQPVPAFVALLAAIVLLLGGCVGERDGAVDPSGKSDSPPEVANATQGVVPYWTVNVPQHFGWRGTEAIYFILDAQTDFSIENFTFHPLADDIHDHGPQWVALVPQRELKAVLGQDPCEARFEELRVLTLHHNFEARSNYNVSAGVWHVFSYSNNIGDFRIRVKNTNNESTVQINETTSFKYQLLEPIPDIHESNAPYAATFSENFFVNSSAIILTEFSIRDTRLFDTKKMMNGVSHATGESCQNRNLESDNLVNTDSVISVPLTMSLSEGFAGIWHGQFEATLALEAPNYTIGAAIIEMPQQT